MKKKSFKLNELQSINIPFEHKIYTEMLIGSLSNINLNFVIDKYLREKGYIYQEPTQLTRSLWFLNEKKYWHHYTGDIVLFNFGLK